MFNFLFTRPLAALLTVAGVAVFAPVIFPIIGVILKPLVGPVTNLYLDLADEMAKAIVEREERQGLSSQKLTSGTERLVAEVAEDKVPIMLRGHRGRAPGGKARLLNGRRPLPGREI